MSLNIGDLYKLCFNCVSAKFQICTSIASCSELQVHSSLTGIYRNSVLLLAAVLNNRWLKVIQVRTFYRNERKNDTFSQKTIQDIYRTLLLSPSSVYSTLLLNYKLVQNNRQYLWFLDFLFFASQFYFCKAKLLYILKLVSSSFQTNFQFRFKCRLMSTYIEI